MERERPAHITLSQLTAAISSAITAALPSSKWVVAEVSECKVAAAGHCYLSLVERDANSASPRAEMRAAIWAQTYRLIASSFRQQTGGDITSGMKLLMCCSVAYHPIYGLSLIISDVDPTYTLGESQRERQMTIARLKTDGIFDMQKGLTPPLVVQRLAVISSATAAGYEDFCKQIEASPYRFETKLFAAAMQGEQTQRSVIEALDSIAKEITQFDLVVIIRGGGSASDLRWFDNYELASNVAQFPLPILTGIGHEKDISVADMVAHRMFKTPTAVAAGLIERIAAFDNRLSSLYTQAITLSQQRLLAEQQRVSRAAQNLRAITMQSLQNAALKLERLRSLIPASALAALDKRRATLELLAERIASHNPRRILKMGYSITTTPDGHTLKSVADAPKGTQLTIELSDGTIQTQVK